MNNDHERGQLVMINEEGRACEIDSLTSKVEL